ncbi:MAG: LysR family transcriptional regulator [Desulfobacterales bacterium]|nr:LysR family transcriptional regulator [Desulfobacterales bacterium]
MEFHQIRSFAMVAETANLTRAAERLNTTPPSVSAHIRQLEDEFDVVLFMRTPKGMKLTPQGKELLSKAEGILQSTREFTRAARRAGKQVAGHLKLGINADPEYLKIQAIVTHLHKSYPGLSLEAAALNTGDILKQLKSGDLDLGYVFGRHEDSRIDFRLLGPVDLAVVVPARYRGTHESTGWKEIAALPWLHPVTICPFLDQVKTLLKDRGISLTRPVVSNDDITRTAYISQGLAVTVLERSEALRFADAGSVFIWENHDPIITRLSLAFLKTNRDHPGIRVMAELIEMLWSNRSGLQHRSTPGVISGQR